ncbi:MAG: adenylate/guanylate cyclase domain-containing protein [Limisphaerales bacterium]
MSRLSFSFKLLFAMMLVVAGVAGVTLWLTQQRVQTAYENLFEEKLKEQLTHVPREQDLRIGEIKRECARFAGLRRIFALLEERDVEQLYLTAQDELRVILGSEEVSTNAGFQITPPPMVEKLKPPKPADGATEKPKPSGKDALRKLAGGKVNRAPRVPYLGFIDAEGKVLEAPELGRFLTAERRFFLERIARLGQTVGRLTEQQVSYLELRNGRLTELIVTPVRDDEKLVGAMVYGIPFFDSAVAANERIFEDLMDIESGTYFEGKLYTHSIPEEVRSELARQLAIEIPANPDVRDDFIIAIHGVPHRVFYTPLNRGSVLPIAHKVGLYSWADALEAQANLRRQILGFSGVAVLVALLVSLALAHGLSIPIRELVGATELIGRGHFGVTVPVRSADDLGQLAQSFNEMAAGLALKEKYHNILHTIADKDVAQQLLEGKIALGGELREVTVMFCDIRGFTALTQNMDPAEVIALLNEHMTALTRVVTAHHGVVDKFIGDSIMAIFGAPKSYGDDTFNAVRCAQQLLVERAQLNRTSRYQIEIGIGLASGQVVAGNMGSADRSNYTVLGERVNLAARLCSVAQRGEIVIGPTTRTQLGDRIAVEEMDPLQLKGFSDSIRAFKLLTVREATQPLAQSA